MINAIDEYPKQVILKDGKECVFRLLHSSDRQALAEFLERIPESERWYLRYDFEADLVKSWEEDITRGRRHAVVAEVDGRLVGLVTLRKRRTGCFAHIGRLWIVVEPDYRGLRLGTWMLLDMINQAVSQNLERVEARFVVGAEDSAIDGARRLDFFEAAHLPRYAKGQDGQYQDVKIMIKRLHPGWDDF